jgi:hypothetical protein
VPPAPGGPSGDLGSGEQAGACEAAKRKLAKAKAKLRDLKQADGPAARVDRAKRKVKRLAKAKRSACSAG